MIGDPNRFDDVAIKFVSLRPAAHHLHDSPDQHESTDSGERRTTARANQGESAGEASYDKHKSDDDIPHGVK